MTRIASLAAIAALIATPAIPASPEAEPLSCGARTDIVSKLGQIFQETPQAVGVVSKDAVIEILVSQTGTWTILATGTNGQSCVISSGENWEASTLASGKDA